MDICSVFEDKNHEYSERYELAVARISEFENEELVQGPFKEYFASICDFVKTLDIAVKKVLDGSLYNASIQDLKELNNNLYDDIITPNYCDSWLNPDYACGMLGKRMGKMLCSTFASLRSMIYEAFCGNLERITIELELIIELYGIITLEGKEGASNVKKAIFYFHHDYCDYFTELRQRRLRTPEYNTIIRILDECDLKDFRYLYYYGAYISDNELMVADYLSKLDAYELEKIADTFVGGYVRGFEAAGIDFSERINVEVRYPIGFELIIKLACDKFRAMGKKIVMYMDESRRIGVSGTLANRQYNYDHRNDFVLYYTNRYLGLAKECLERTYIELRDAMKVIAGPACMETFGEADFEPVNKETAINPDDKMNSVITKHKTECAMLLRKFADMEKVSFTIIAYPLPEIGSKFDEIFTATNMVNMLDNGKYRDIQQKIIDTLDKGEFVTVKGAGSNKTMLRISLHRLNNPEKETNFENCTADVNIPVGEVFTSPVLKGTDGTLHVSKAFLEGLEFENLCIEFKDGMIDGYSCENFENEDENKKYIEENILFRHPTLPMGEFAIGTNTTAYRMANDYNIWRKLPILIAEKTGPHFAVGDTCYSDSEDFMTYNPDGKAIIARDNEVSALRNTDRSKAYFHCHTDITIPYDELDYIRVHCDDGKVLSVIEGGRFVIPGTEELNNAF